MWRREERLKYWLENRSQSQKPGFSFELIKSLSLKLRLWQHAGTVNEESLTLSTGIVCLDSALGTTANVRDGFGVFGKENNTRFDSVTGFEECNSQIHSGELLVGSNAVNLPLPDERLARIRHSNVSIAPACRTFLLSFRGIEVHELMHPQYQPPQLMDGSRYLITSPRVQNLTNQMAELPLMRTSIATENLQDSERKGFLCEAEALKGLSSDRAELLAVFRHVPIEMISRLRFLAEKRAILFSILLEAKTTRTRVHDLAAVQDTVSKEIYLVPHRTKFRPVSLN